MIYGPGWRGRALRRALRAHGRHAKWRHAEPAPAIILAIVMVVGLAYLLTATWISLFARMAWQMAR